MKGNFIELAYSPQEGHAAYKYRLVMDETTLALASGADGYVPHTAYLTVDHSGNIHLVKPNEMDRIVPKEEVQKKLGLDVYLDFIKLQASIS